MSYILDALKKADAEREQGRVPGLHTHSVQMESESMPLGPPTPPWVMGLFFLLALAALGAAWLWTRQPVALTEQTVAVKTPQAEPASTAIAPKAQVTQASNDAGTTTAFRKNPAAPIPIGAATPTARSPIHENLARRSASSSKVPSLSELPESVRRNLPALAVSGAMYSDQPANRMLLINNRVFHEGDQPMAGLVLEEIRLKSAVFRYQEHRFSMSY